MKEPAERVFFFFVSLFALAALVGYKLIGHKSDEASIHLLECFLIDFHINTSENIHISILC